MITLPDWGFSLWLGPLARWLGLDDLGPRSTHRLVGAGWPSSGGRLPQRPSRRNLR